MSRDHSENVARRKLGVDQSWEMCRWNCIGDGDRRDAIYSLGVPRLLKSGPRKGQKTWRDFDCRDVVVTDEETAAEFARYEAEEKKCGECFGSGEVFAGWSATNGVRNKPCGRCGGTGKVKESAP